MQNVIKLTSAQKTTVRAFLNSYLHNLPAQTTSAKRKHMARGAIELAYSMLSEELDPCYESAEFLAEMLENQFGGDDLGVVGASFL